MGKSFPLLSFSVFSGGTYLFKGRRHAGLDLNKRERPTLAYRNKNQHLAVCSQYLWGGRRNTLRREKCFCRNHLSKLKIRICIFPVLRCEKCFCQNRPTKRIYEHADVAPHVMKNVSAGSVLNKLEVQQFRNLESLISKKSDQSEGRDHDQLTKTKSQFPQIRSNRK